MKLLYILPIALLLSGCDLVAGPLGIPTETNHTEAVAEVEDLSPNFKIAEEVQVVGPYVSTPTYITNVGSKTEEIYSIMINRNEDCMVYAWAEGSRAASLIAPGREFGEYRSHVVLNIGDGVRLKVPDGCGREIVMLDIVTSNGYYTFDNL